MFKYESINNYHSDLQKGLTSCYAAVEYYLLQIEKKKNLNAFLNVYGQESLQKARHLDEKRKNGQPIGKLHGIVVALKDIICYKDHPISAASRILKDFISIYNATAVEMLLKEEAIIIGHTNCDEFAMGSTNENSSFGPVLNAFDETKVPGGSSGGSAVAVQAGLCMVSLGSDTGGSVRQPADFCGIVGFKPGYGRISRHGLLAYASSFDQIGIFATNVPDAATVLQIISGRDKYDSTVSAEDFSADGIFTKPVKKPLRIAYFAEALNTSSLDKEISASIKSFMTRLKEQGHVVEAVDFKYMDHIVPAYYVLTTAEASSNLARYDGIKYGFRPKDREIPLIDLYRRTRSEGFGKEVKRRIMLGTFVLSAGYFDAYFTKAQKVRKLLVAKTRLIFNEFDAIILPTAPSTAFRFGEKMKDPVSMYLADIFTVFANLVGLPAISIPLFWHSNGMPFGLQIMTNQFSDLYLLQLSHLWMQQFKSSG